MLGDRLDLSSYLLKPVQRMGKYALLLQQIIKECSTGHQEYNDLKVTEKHSLLCHPFYPRPHNHFPHGLPTNRPVTSLRDPIDLLPHGFTSDIAVLPTS